MRIVINIDDNLYARLFDNGVNNYDDAVDMAKAIRKGILLPKNATNGDIIRAMFPKAEVIEKRAVVMVGISRMIVFDFDWWNAPYKAESEDKEEK